jgi:uncharacterized protein (TIGR01777 family)
VAALLERGDDVVPFVRPDTPVSTGARIRLDPPRGDVDDGDLRQVGGLDAVLNLAGAGIADRRWSPARRTAILASRLDTTRTLALAVSGLGGVATVASGSAVGYYGSRGDEVLDETSSAGTDFLADVCRQWEEAASAMRRDGTPVALLRTGIVMSRTGGALKRQLPLFRAGVGGRIARGDHWLTPISLRDETRAILWTLDHRHDGPVNLVAPAAATNAQFTKALGRAVHRPARVPVPSAALKLVLGSALVEEAVLASQRVTPRVLVEEGFVFEDRDLDAILTWAVAH